MSNSKKNVQLVSSNGTLDYVSTEKVSIKNHPHLNENWLHKIIIDNPSILGLGDLELRSHEKSQPKAGRLDLLLEDVNNKRRYEIEVQLGKSDESHIIRTIEYWENERKRYPQYDHCAVIIAEDITSHFLNVISLFNGHIPIIAIQVNAFQIQNQVSLLFTKVLDAIELGTPELETIEAPKNRAFWEEKGTPKTVGHVDLILSYINEFSDGYQLNYNKNYIGLIKNNKAENFVAFKPQKTNIRIDLGCEIDSELKDELEESGIVVLEYSRGWKVQPISVTLDQVVSRNQALISALKYAYNKYYSS